MDAQAFLDNFGTIADAPGGVERLRELILDLAVCGKLVSQDPMDDPATELLGWITAEKATIIGETGVREGKRPAPLAEPGSDLPPGWIWTQLYALGFVGPRNDVDDSAIAGFVPMTLIPAELKKPHSFEERSWGEIKKSYTHVANGDVAVAKITPCFENGKSTVFESLPGGVGAATTELHVLRPIPGGVVPGYVLVYLKSPQFRRAGEPRMTGTAGQKRLPREYFSGAPFPLPPRPEQERIVAKVEELMRLCDDLESRQQVLHHITGRLRASSLDALTNAETDDDLHTAWSRIHANWEALTDHHDSIGALRQAVLQLAVEGRLANSDAADASADELLEAIKPGSAPRAEIDRSLIPYDVPAAWRWVHLESVCTHVVDCLHKTPRYVEDGYPVIRTSDVEPGRILMVKARLVDQQTFEERTSRLRPAAGDVVYSREGGRFGIAAVVPADVDLCLGQRMMQFRCADGVEPEYLCWFLNSPLGFGQASADVGGSASPHVNIKAIRRFLLPLPPSAEQRRIVARIRELMDRCDQLEARLGVRNRVGALLAGSMASAAAS